METKVLNQAVKRNIKRFPEDFLFQLTSEEWDILQHQITMTNSPTSLRSQIVTLKSGRGQHLKYLPYAFTEQGVALLSSVLHSDKAISMNIAIIRAFLELRKTFLAQTDLREQIKQLRDRVGEHDTQLNHIYDAMENLLDEKASQRKWEERNRIGFK